MMPAPAAAAGPVGRTALAVLVREIAHREGGQLAIPRIDEDEADFETLRGLAFKSGAETIGVAADATR